MELFIGVTPNKKEERGNEKKRWWWKRHRWQAVEGGDDAFLQCHIHHNQATNALRSKRLLLLRSSGDYPDRLIPGPVNDLVRDPTDIEIFHLGNAGSTNHNGAATRLAGLFNQRSGPA